MKLLKQMSQDGRGDNLNELLKHIPYAAFLGLTVEHRDNEVITVLPFNEQLVGNVNLPAIHGGAIGALLEATAVLQLIADTGCQRFPKTIDVSFDYLRSARACTTYGRAIVTRQGRRVANVRAELWQDNRSKPVAAGHGHFLLSSLD